jgi:hypothetical protein
MNILQLLDIPYESLCTPASDRERALFRMMYSLLERSALVAIRTLLPYLISASTRLNGTLGYLSHECTTVLEPSTAKYAIHSFFRVIMVPFCRILALGAAITSALAFERVDTHIHALPAPYIEALEAAGGDPSGYLTPNWTLEATIGSMNQVNTDIGE